MANKVLLKKSSVGARVPLVGDLDYGELALNYADGKLYYKTSANAIDLYPSATATATLTNKTLTSPVIGTIVNTGTLTLPTSTDTLVGRATTDTLTNKTLSSAILTGTLTAGGGVGEEGQVLTSTVTGVSWTTPAGGGGGSGNSFTTIAVSGQSSVLADSATDTLTLAAAGVIGIITSPSTDTITFTTNKSFPFTKYDGNASNIPLFTEASALATSLDTVYLPFAKSDGTSVTTLKLTA
jgi:hypothetical protein